MPSERFLSKTCGTYGVRTGQNRNRVCLIALTQLVKCDPGWFLLSGQGSLLSPNLTIHSESREGRVPNIRVKGWSNPLPSHP